MKVQYTARLRRPGDSAAKVSFARRTARKQLLAQGLGGPSQLRLLRPWINMEQWEQHLWY